MAMQKSSRSATVNGIKALDMALKGVDRIRKDVESTGATLRTNYRGVDGGKFSSLLAQWNQQADIISKNLAEVMDELNNTLRAHGETQRTTSDWVDASGSKSSAVFDALAG